jgi:hypothetical protein
MRRSALILVMLLGGCTAPADRAVEPTLTASITGKVWLATNPAAAPGTLRVFLEDGTLLMTSCGETYRLARWTAVGDRRVAWDEDTAHIEADIAALTPNELQMRLQLTQDIKEEHYRVATVPYVCPDRR